MPAKVGQSHTLLSQQLFTQSGHVCSLLSVILQCFQRFFPSQIVDNLCLHVRVFKSVHECMYVYVHVCVHVRVCISYITGLPAFPRKAIVDFGFILSHHPRRGNAHTLHLHRSHDSTSLSPQRPLLVHDKSDQPTSICGGVG